MFRYLVKRPLLLCGLIAVLLSLAAYYSYAAVFVSGMILLILFFWWLASAKSPGAVVSVGLLFVFCLSLLITLRHIAALSQREGSTVEGYFLVAEEPVLHVSHTSQVLEVVQADDLAVGERIWTVGDLSEAETGNLIKAQIKFYVPEDFSRKSGYANGEYLFAEIKQADLKMEEGDFVLCRVRMLRDGIADMFFDHMGYREAATLLAMVTGDRSYISDSFYGLVKQAGVAHVLVVSGMHLTVLVALASRFTQLLTSKKWARMLMIAATVLFMATLCGFTKSILRAGMCYLLYGVSVLFDRENTPENTLGAAVLLLLMDQPFSVFSVSFQLSVLSTLGIVAFGLPILRYMEETDFLNNRILRYLLSSVVITYSATLFTLPVTAYVFGYVSVVGVLTNLIISPVVTLALGAAMVMLILGRLFPFSADALFLLLDLLLRYINAVIIRLGSLPFASVDTGKSGFVFSLLLLAAGIAILFYFKQKIERQKKQQMQKKIISETKPRYRQ